MNCIERISGHPATQYHQEILESLSRHSTVTFCEGREDARVPLGQYLTIHYFSLHPERTVLHICGTTYRDKPTYYASPYQVYRDTNGYFMQSIYSDSRSWIEKIDQNEVIDEFILFELKEGYSKTIQVYDCTTSFFFYMHPERGALFRLLLQAKRRRGVYLPSELIRLLWSYLTI
jgi:hypothetical protein